MSRFAKSISNLGDLYTVLQMFVLGAHLKSKRYVPLRIPVLLVRTGPRTTATIDPG